MKAPVRADGGGDDPTRPRVHNSRIMQSNFCVTSLVEVS